MIDKICTILIDKMKEEMPEIDDEKAEIINYGLQLIIGEIPKIFIMLGISYLLGIFKLTLITFFIILPYRTFSGGFHLHTHIGCIITTCAMYCGTAILSKYIILNGFIKTLMVVLVLIFGIAMIKLYAPADTEEVPILRKKDRRKKQILSYITLVIALIIAEFIRNSIISNIIIIGYFIQTCTITRLAYKITNNHYGHEVYNNG